MVIIHQKVYLISSLTVLVLSLFLSLGGNAYGDVLFMKKAQKARETSTAPDELISSQDFTIDPLAADDVFSNELKARKAANPVALFFTTLKEKLSSVSSAKDDALRDITDTAISNGSQWPFALAGLLFVMLMMRLRRRTRKSKFS